MPSNLAFPLKTLTSTDSLVGFQSATVGGERTFTPGATGALIFAGATASDVRSTLGLGSLATQSGTFSGTSSGTNTGDQNLSGLLVKASNLSDLTSVSTARTNLGLGSLATQSGTFSGTSSGTNTGDQDLSGYLTKAGNLSGLVSTSTARTNLGLGTAATRDVGQAANNVAIFSANDTFGSLSIQVIGGQVSAFSNFQLGINSTLIYGASVNGVTLTCPNTSGTLALLSQVGDRYLTSSTTSNTVSNGAKTFTVGTGLAYTPTQDITIVNDAAHHMHAAVTTYNSTTGVLVVDVNTHTGTGTFTSWTVNVGGISSAVIPIGGTTGQVLSKASPTNYDTVWSTLGNAATRDVGQAAGNLLELNSANQITIGDGGGPSGSILITGPDGVVFVSNDNGQLVFNDSEAGSISLSQIALTSQLPTFGTGVATALATNLGTTGSTALRLISSDTTPASPNAMDEWYDSATGARYVRYGSVWVETSGSTIGNALATTTSAGMVPTLGSTTDRAGAPTRRQLLVSNSNQFTYRVLGVWLNNAATSGTGTAISSETAGNVRLTSGASAGARSGVPTGSFAFGAWNSNYVVSDWGLTFFASGTMSIFHTGTAASDTRIRSGIGKPGASLGQISARGFMIEVQWNGTNYEVFCAVHNGTVLNIQTTGITFATQRTVLWSVEADGLGNAVWYVSVGGTAPFNGQTRSNATLTQTGAPTGVETTTRYPFVEINNGASGGASITVDFQPMTFSFGI